MVDFTSSFAVITHRTSGSLVVLTVNYGIITTQRADKAGTEKVLNVCTLNGEKNITLDMNRNEQDELINLPRELLRKR